MSTTTIPTREQLRSAARLLAKQAGRGGFCVFGAETLDGGEWYSQGSHPQLERNEIAVAVPHAPSVPGDKPSMIAATVAIREKLVEREAECEHCHGRGFTELDGACPECGGTGHDLTRVRGLYA